MTLVLCTSSPVVSVALFKSDQQVTHRSMDSRESGSTASGILVNLVRSVLSEANVSLGDLTQIAVDSGPGGFTSTRVGVTFAKTLAWTLGVNAVPVTSFDLVDPEMTVCLPSKKGWVYRRVPGQAIEAIPSECMAEAVPSARNYEKLVRLGRTSPIDPRLIVPNYVAEPSISKPKNARVCP
ncbi:MAG: tRNA (adenosine(37)-N6)-threonylcarbamoyltransferase complex dimerization subunit type 1 TsaB [Chthonomonadaceae bacterium]|nr:tRNA (adenosine(37)-N6)-threonylcarbamoyltransferase complex dimerization subunit type 1 TsaB [Chthonomonadaceae bacterium]